MNGKSNIQGIEAVIEGIIGRLALDREAARESIAAMEINAQRHKDAIKKRLHAFIADYQNDWHNANQKMARHV